MLEDNMDHRDDGNVSVESYFRITQPLAIENSIIDGIYFEDTTTNHCIASSILRLYYKH